MDPCLCLPLPLLWGVRRVRGPGRYRPVLSRLAVEAGGQRFLVMASPDTAWGVEHVFIVAGSSTAFVHGRTVLPELILDDGCDT